MSVPGFALAPIVRRAFRAGRSATMISVIIPTLNAEAGLGGTLTALVPAAVDGLVREVIVVDGGSDDRTAAIVDQAGAQLVSRSGGRGYQLEAGARRARFPWLLFLHADTVLESGWERDALAFMEAVDGGKRALAAAAFRFGLDDIGLRPRVLERLVAMRCALLRLPYGDQGLLIPKLLYAEIGGYNPHPLMEDVDIVRRLGATARGHVAFASCDERGALSKRRLPAAFDAQPRLPVPLFPRSSDHGHQPPLPLRACRTAASHEHHMRVRMGWPSSRRRLRMRSLWLRPQQVREWRHAQHLTSWIRDFSGRSRRRLWSRRAAGVHRICVCASRRPRGNEVVKFKVGDVEVIQMYDGIWERAARPGFVKNASLDDVKAALKAGGLTDAHVPIPFTVTAVRTIGGLVLIDSGTGAQVAPTAGLHHQEQPLGRRRHRPDQGHKHRHLALPSRPHHRPDGQGHQRPDLPECPDSCAGRRIQVLDQSGHHGRVLPSGFRPCSRDWKNIKQFEGDKEVVPGVRPIATPGHTAGHTSYHVGSGSQQLIVLGDLTNMPALFVKNPGWHAAFDTDGPPGGSQPPQDVRPRHRRQGDDHRIPLRHAGGRHDRQGRQRLRLHADQGLRSQRAA